MAPRDQLKINSCLDPNSHQSVVKMKDMTTRPSVIVIGAGMAGLAAAHALQIASIQVTVLESRNRIGGRVYTDYSFGFPVDMGASWLHGVCQENPLAALIGELGLPLYRTSGEDSVLYDHDLESFALYDMDGHQVPKELVASVGRTFETLLQEINSIRAEFPEDISVLKAFSLVLERRPDLRLEGVQEKVLQWYFCRLEGWFAADADNISAQCWDQEQLLGGGHGLMVEGYSPVITALSKGLNIQLNHRVSKIIQQPHGVRVATEAGEIFDADAAIVAVPLGVLKANLITFEPRLPDWKETAIRELGVGNENKIALKFEQVWWPDVEFLGEVASTPYECSYFLNLHKATGNPVLVYMPSGRLAKDIERLSDEEASKFAVSQLRKILPNASEPLQCLVSRWGTDTSSLGCYSYNVVGKSSSLYEHLRAPVDNLFFAGEATNQLFPGTLHGAFATGVIAAQECQQLASQYWGLQLFQPTSAQISRITFPLQISRM
ncbi:hypothetical protein O6H91_03G058900 [Diphasiastrum complanatum]|uniref:Uncharacterized protein n=1 Tax=Diphasiastrum complanatum TaxID=34168 RepID=A0ACC2E6Y3_DIPCM|nr:hypothetical protein O6H91_03G058900 [Diphasiastrum complanatum]